MEERKGKVEIGRSTSLDPLKRILCIGIVLCAGVACAPAAWGQTQREIISWAGNTADWNRRLGVMTIRMGCDGEPASCMQAVDPTAREEGVNRIALAVVLEEATAARYASEYSALSLSHPKLVEISLDDFNGQYNSGTHADAPGLLRRYIANLKSKNPNLKFGVTLYETELTGENLHDPKLPSDLRKNVDTVCLYLIYRKDGPNYPTYVRKVRQLFPNAKVLAGVYAYDRIDYVECHDDLVKCSPTDEINLFRQTLEIQLRLMQTGAVDGIEFYPGGFGKEETLYEADRQKCAANRRQACVNNTKTMRQFTLQRLRIMKITANPKRHP